MESRIKSSMENLSDIQRDTWSGLQGYWWGQCEAKCEKIGQGKKQHEPTYPVFGLQVEWERVGVVQNVKKEEKIKRKNELMIIEGPCDSKTFMVFAICLNETKNESVKKTKQEMWEMTAMGMPWERKAVHMSQKELVRLQEDAARQHRLMSFILYIRFLTLHKHWTGRDCHTDTYFFCSFLFFSAGPPRVPTPKPSFGELSASGVPART